METASPNSSSLPLYVYFSFVVSEGLGVLVVVSTGIVADVSVPIPDGCVVVELLSIVVGVDVSDPVEFSGVSQPTAAIAKKAMNKILFMRNAFS